jgi:two-component system NarL family sensor kinase
MPSPPYQRRTGSRDADTDVLLRRNRELAALKSIAETLNKGVDLHTTLANTLPLLVDLLGLHTGWLFLLDAEADFSLGASHNLPPALTYPGEVWEDECTCQKLARSGNLRGTAQVVECSRLRDATGDRQGLAYHASVPLQEGERLLGIMNVATSEWNLFTPQDLQILSSVGYQLATAIERIQLAERSTHLALVEERNRLAREVHDTLAQELAGIALQLEAADALLERSPSRARIRIRQALERTRESLDEVRRTVLDLRAGPLERQSLAEALEALVQRISAESNLTITLQIELGEQRLAARSEAALYRISQEALANVRQHAHASHASLELWLTDTEVILQISDNGRGFDVDAPRQPGRGFGLIGMQERARLLNGTLSVCSEPGTGTQIEVRLPLE